MKKTIIIKHNSAYFFRRLSRFPVLACFSDRNLDLGFKRGIKNRSKFLLKLGINYKDLVCVKQPHKSKIKIVDIRNKGKGALSFNSAISGADGLITNRRNIPLAIFTADCLSIFLFCPKTKTIAIIHAGWRSTKGNISKKAVELMKSRFNSNPKDIIACFGPAIRDCCYEVEREFKKYFKNGLVSRWGKLFLDLIKINRQQLVSSGIKEKNIVDSEICTACKNNVFFSYRKEKAGAGRMISLMMLK